MNKEFKIYHTETQEDYDDLMIKLEAQGYKWMSGDKPTIKSQYWDKQRENTAIVLDGLDERHIARGSISWCKGLYSNAPVIKHKAKGVKNMEKVVVPQFVADWYEGYQADSLYSTLSYFLNGVGSTEELEKWGETCEGESAYPKVNAEKKIAKMHIYGYEVEEEKKYYWRKKKEYTFGFEHHRSTNYLNFHRNDNELFFDDIIELVACRTKFTETEVKQLVSEEDFNKLEKVEITDDER